MRQSRAKEKDVQICLVCGKTVKEVNSWVHCPEINMSICMTHCFNNCQHLNKGTSVVRCTYRYKYL